MNEHGIQELVNLLRGEPDELSFRAACAAVDAVPLGDIHEAIGVGDTLMGSWPDQDRTVEPHWYEIDGLLRSPSWPLVRGLRVELLANEAELPRREQWLARLASRAEISNLRRLRIEGVAPDGENDVSGLRVLTSETQLTNLKSLELVRLVADEDAARFVRECVYLSGLCELGLGTDCPPAGYPAGEHWGSILRAGRFANLTRLAMEYPAPADIAVVASAFPALQELSITGLSGEVVKALLRHPTLLERLRALRLSGGLLDANDFALLAACPYFGSLRCLELPSSGLGPYSIAPLSRASFLHELTHLDLSDNPLGDDGWNSLSSWQLPQLVRLSLRNTGAANPGLRSLAESQGLPRLVELDLGGVECTDEAGDALANAAWLAGLRSLNLEFHHPGFGDRGAAALLQSPSLRQLRSLVLARAGMTDVGLRPLLSSPARLSFLDLTKNPIGPAGAHILAQAEALRDVRSLHLGLCELQDDGLRALARYACWHDLRALTLTANRLSHAGFAALAESRHTESIWELWLDYNHAGLRGAEVLAKSPLRKLLRLDLTDCQFGRDAWVAILRSPLIDRLDRLPAGLDLDPALVLELTGARLRPRIRSFLQQGGRL